MKTFMIIAALSVLSLSHPVEAQDGKSVRTHSQIAQEMLAALPTTDNHTTPAPMFSTDDVRLISMLPLMDTTGETPGVVEEKAAVAKTTDVNDITPKADVKTGTEARRTDK